MCVGLGHIMGTDEVAINFFPIGDIYQYSINSYDCVERENKILHQLSHNQFYLCS